MNTTPDGDFQTYRAEDGAFIREHFFGRDERTAALVKDWSDDDIWGKLRRGGLDYRKVYAAYKAAVEHKGQPTVILAKTIKGYGLGHHFEGRNATHQMKKMTLEDLKHFRDSMRIPISDAQLEENPYLPPYYNPGQQDETIQYMLERRRALGGFLPERRIAPRRPAAAGRRGVRAAEEGLGHAGDRHDHGVRPPAEGPAAREGLRPPHRADHPRRGAHVRHGRVLPDGEDLQPERPELHLGRPRAAPRLQGEPAGPDHPRRHQRGGRAWRRSPATGTSYSTHGEPLIPVYVFYSMFGFQRTGDAQWAAGDQMARGFIIGATAGRTTLTGEGLQHADGHSHLLASTNPATVSYDPAYGYEIAHIVRSGLERMYGGNHPDPNVMYYLTVYNEPLVQPAEPEGVDVDGIVRGIHRISDRGGRRARAPRSSRRASACRGRSRRSSCCATTGACRPTSGRSRRGPSCAATASPPTSTTSSTPTRSRTPPTSPQKLQDAPGPVVAVSDYMHAVQDQIRQWVPQPLRDPRRRRLRLLGHARRRAPLLQDRRPVDRRPHAAGAGRGGRRRPRPRRAGDREVPPARRDGRNERQRGRRELTRTDGRLARRRWTRPRRSPGCGASRVISRRRRSSGSKTRSPGTPRCRRRGAPPSGWSRRPASRRSSSGTTTRRRRPGSRPTSSPPLRGSCCAA